MSSTLRNCVELPAPPSPGPLVKPGGSRLTDVPAALAPPADVQADVVPGMQICARRAPSSLRKGMLASCCLSSGTSSSKSCDACPRASAGHALTALHHAAARLLPGRRKRLLQCLTIHSDYQQLFRLPSTLHSYQSGVQLAWERSSLHCQGSDGLMTRHIALHSNCMEATMRNR